MQMLMFEYTCTCMKNSKQKCDNIDMQLKAEK